MAISPTAAPNLISMEIGSSLSSLCACFQVPLRCISDPADQSGSEEKIKSKRKWNHYFFYLIQRFQFETAIPSACGRRTPIHSRNPVFVPAVCCPPLPLPCPLLKERRHSKHPFLLFCRASWHPPSCLGLMEIKKKKEKEEEDGNIKQRENTGSQDLFSSLLFSPLLALRPAETGAWGETSEWQRCTRSSPLLSLALPPSFPPCVSLCPSLLVSLSAARCLTQKQAALSWRVRRLYACRDICECAYVGGLK